MTMHSFATSNSNFNSSQKVILEIMEKGEKKSLYSMRIVVDLPHGKTNTVLVFFLITTIPHVLVRTSCCSLRELYLP